MLLIIACAMFFTEVRNLIFSAKALWIEWQIRATVVASLCVQLLLIKLGNRRRCNRKLEVYTAWMISLMYLFGDWIATVALSSLLRSSEDDLTSPLAVFWAPFLLLHLGGPDTTTAYSLSESQEWVKHLLGLFYQLWVALYVYVKFWTITRTTLTYLAIPAFVVGIIKYGERVWALFSASDEQLRKVVFATPTDSGITDFRSVDIEQGAADVTKIDDYLQYKRIPERCWHLHRAYLSFRMFGPLFLDLKLRLYKELRGLFTLKPTTAEKAFEMVEHEVGFLYDLLYTKIPIILSGYGLILRSICSSFLLSILIAFSVIIGNQGYPKVDIAISYLLLVGAVFLEIYSIVLHFSCDRGIQWLTSQDNKLFKVIGYGLDSISKTNKINRGIQSMPQISLIEYCLKAKSCKFTDVGRIFDSGDFMGKYGATSWKDIEPDLKDRIYTHLIDKRDKYRQEGFHYAFLLHLLDERGEMVLHEKDCHEALRSIKDVEFTHSLLIWHVATDLVFHQDHQRHHSGNLGPYCNISKLLSDYMMYLLFLCPTMLPQGIIQLRLRDTCADAMRLFDGYSTDEDAFQVMNGLDFKVRSIFVKMVSQSKSVFFEGGQLADQLQDLVLESRWDHEEKWEMIGRVWLEMLTHAASQCTWKEHAKQLKRGEELLTRVALLMAHLGLSKDIQMLELPQELKDIDYWPRWDWGKLDRLGYYLA